MKLTLDYGKSQSFFDGAMLQDWLEKAAAAKKTLVAKNGAGSEFTGWIDWPVNYDREEVSRIQKAAEKIKNDSDAVVVIGIGGSYLGAAAAIDFMMPEISKEDQKVPEIFYAGNNLSGPYLEQILAAIKNKDFSIVIISKSGTTTEPAISFRIFRALLEEKYKDQANRRIYAITDREKGILKTLSREQGYETFVVPDDIGGRYSVLTPVGLLPIACAGIDIAKILDGAAKMREHLLKSEQLENDALIYAALRHLFMHQGKQIEILESYDPAFRLLGEWWKQLFGESEGKCGKGLFPATLSFTTDLHSVGQYIQDGQRNMFETVIEFTDDGSTLAVEAMKGDGDGLNFLDGMTLQEINRAALRGTICAHIDGGVPNLILKLQNRSAETLGQLFYFFEFACGVSAYMLGVNPFDQPGVESYKRNMFALLGKPGYEKEGEALRKRV